MKKMKKLICLALAAIMIFAMAACGSSSAPAAGSSSAPAAEAPKADDTVYTLNFYHIFAGVGHEQKWINKAIEEIECLTSKTFDSICIFGGGNKNQLVNRMTEELTGKMVRLGPSEATSFGNVLGQIK